MRPLHCALFLCLLAIPSPAAAQMNDNFPDRRATIANVCPSIELSEFSFKNVYSDRATRFQQNIKWKNIGSKSIVAFEMTILKYDPFDRRLVGTRWLVPGTNSADWRPLAPGAGSSDGVRGYGSEDVYTAIAFVRLVRFADNEVWQVEPEKLLTELRRVAPGISDFGSTAPDPKPEPAQP